MFSGARLRAIRSSRGLSYRRLAVAANLGKTSLAEWEGGVVLPNARQVATLCRALNCTPNDLFAPVGEG